MDPISIAASTIAFIGACRKLASGLRFLSDVSQAPKEVLALTDELHDLQHVLTAVGLVVRKRGDNILGSLLVPLFHKVDRIIHELCDVCGACPQKLKQDDEYYGEQLKIHLLARFRWTLAKQRVNELRERLKVLRLDFSNSLAATSLLDLSHITTELSNLSTQLSVNIPEQTLLQSEDPPPYEPTPMILTAQSKFKALDVEAQRESFAAEPNLPLDFQGPRSYVSRSGPCKQACSCACHSVYRVKSPTILQNLVGSLLVKHNGLYGMNPACNEHSCQRSPSASLRISYRFPEWLMNRMVSSVILSNRVDGPQLSLIVPRIVPNTSDIFFHAFAGNIAPIAKLFQSGLASPCDISGMWGYTSLHYAVDRGHLDLCRFLLNAGARPEITDLEEHSVTDMAWNKICLKKVSGEKATELRDMFKKDEWLEERQFTLLHKVVLDLLPTPRDLHEELSMSTSNIDSPDSEGRTPLSWAAETGHLSAVQTLLYFGASVSSKSINGDSPLHYAARAPTPVCLQALLKHGAPVAAKNKWDQSPLNIASYSQNEESFINPLLDHGADVNERDYYGSTPLSCAVFMNQFNTARCLLARGANADAHDLNVMNDSIENNSHECISLLLQNRANLSTANIYGETSLHVLARRGDLRTMEIFQTAELEGLDPEARTNERLTAQDVIRQRLDVTDELQSAFRVLMTKLQPESEHVSYFDALEKVPPVVAKIPDLVEVKVEEILVE